MNLKDLRLSYELTQQEAANILEVPVRSYRRYELDENYGSVIKRKMFELTLEKKCEITEEKGILTIKQITEIVTKLFEEEFPNQIDFCFLFGSYAKGKQTDRSDIDLYVASNITGLKFVGLIEKLRMALHKKVDVIRASELNNNVELVNEIMKYGIKIYG